MYELEASLCDGLASELRNSLTLESSLYINEYYVFSLSGSVSNDVELVGTHSFILLKIGADASLTLDSLTLRGGYSGDDAYDWGGAVQMLNGGVLTMSNCILSDNTGEYGGAVYTDFNSIVTVRNSLFYGNSGAYGGAWYAWSGEVSVHGSTFLDNTASGAGALRLNQVVAYFASTRFEGNNASYCGAVQASGDCTVTFDDVFLDGGGCSFVNNRASGSYGGALGVTDSKLSLAGARFVANSAATDGGALYVQGDMVATLGSGSALVNNLATRGGGAFVDEGAELDVVSTVFAGNAANGGDDLHVASDAANVTCAAACPAGTGDLGCAAISMVDVGDVVGGAGCFSCECAAPTAVPTLAPTGWR